MERGFSGQRENCNHLENGCQPDRIMRTMFGRAHSSRVKPLGDMQAVIDTIYKRRIKNDVKTQR